MVEHKGIQKKIDRGRGKAAQRVGQPWNVYRLGDNAATAQIDPLNLIKANFKVFTRRLRKAEYLETALRQGTLWYDIVGDMDTLRFEVGDVFVLNDAYFDATQTKVGFSTPEFNGWVLSYHGAVKHAVGARVNILGQVKRLTGTPVDGTWQNNTASAQSLVLNHGVYELSAPGGAGSWIPMGFMSFERTYGLPLFQESPGSPKHTLWNVYVPPLPYNANPKGYGGFWIKEGDRIELQDGSTYSVLHPYRQEVGDVGFQIIVERERSAG